MKAIVFTQYGTPNALEIREVPTPEPKDDELLIRVHASSVNSWDWEYLNGVPFVNRLMFGLLRPKLSKQRLGADIAGTIEKVGRDVTRFQPGERVFGDLWDKWGGFAEYASIPETEVEAIPENVTFLQAAAVPQAGVLALQAIRKAPPLEQGQKVLINGAGGGVGTFAIQLAKLAGAEVTGVDASHKLDVVRSVGADHVIDFERRDFMENGERYDLIIDCLATRSMLGVRRSLRRRGTYAMVGAETARVWQLWLLAPIARLTRDDRRLSLIAEGPNKGLAYLRDLLSTGDLTPVMDRTFPLSEVPRALSYFGEGLHKGKIAITMDEE